MSLVDYENDNSGGLMPQILALTAPPGARDNRQPIQTTSLPSQLNVVDSNQSRQNEGGLAAHPYFKRPGKGHNHDCCDACSEGGDLICCDSCPASFHLTCHDPPLDEDELPTGDWACHQCRMGVVVEKPFLNNNSINNVKSKTLKTVKRKEKTESKVKPEVGRKVVTGGRAMVISDSPLATLIKAVAVMNPTQFSLPYEMTLPSAFPGEPKESLNRKSCSKKYFSKKKPYELDNGLVPLPAKLCFQCTKSCRTGPMIPCDYCSLLFHLDCLDPPLTTPPMGLWMCPNHPEHHMDAALLTSHSLSERVRLWDRFTSPVDQNAVKLMFFRQCHRKNPPFRYKVKRALRSRMRVPRGVKAHYMDPPDLLPSNPSFHSRASWVYSDQPPFSHTPSPTLETSGDLSVPHLPLPSIPNGLPPEETNSKSLWDHKPEEKHEMSTTKEYSSKNSCTTQEEKNQWLSGLLKMQCSIMKYMSANGVAAEPVKSESADVELASLDASSTEDVKPGLMNGDLSPPSLGKVGVCDNKAGLLPLPALKRHSIFSHSSSTLNNCVRDYRKHRSLNNITKKKRLSPSSLLCEALGELKLSLRQRVEENFDVSLSDLDRSIVDVLALERMKQIMAPPRPEVVLKTPPVAARALLCPLVPDVTLRDFAPLKEYSRKPVSMSFRSLHIGKGCHNNVDLDMYGHCNFVSPHHASIIFDEATARYELLNYSEFATSVDGVSFVCDFSDVTLSHSGAAPILAQVRQIIAERRKRPHSSSPRRPERLAMNSRPGQDFVRCSCRETATSRSDSSERGWEGAAVLHHGSYLRFGCIKFLFSVVEEASRGDWARDTLDVYRKFVARDSDGEETGERSAAEASAMKLQREEPPTEADALKTNKVTLLVDEAKKRPAKKDHQKPDDGHGRKQKRASPAELNDKVKGHDPATKKSKRDISAAAPQLSPEPATTDRELLADRTKS